MTITKEYLTRVVSTSQQLVKEHKLNIEIEQRTLNSWRVIVLGLFIAGTGHVIFYTADEPDEAMIYSLLDKKLDGQILRIPYTSFWTFHLPPLRFHFSLPAYD